jgi:hypothetical protein
MAPQQSLGWLWLACCSLIVLPTPLSWGQDAISSAAGDVLGSEHFAFGRASMPEGLSGPALETLKSWDGEIGGTFGSDGAYYHLDVNNCLVFRFKDGRSRILAGTGVRGHRDGPADQAQLDLGVGSYSDADIRGDAAGNLYITEATAGRIRKLHRRDDGQWWVTTIAGGGEKMPQPGESIPALEMKNGCASRIAVTPDGTIYFANWGGIYQIKDGQGTLLVGADELTRTLGEKTPIADWHVGGSHITADNVFYWMPGGGPNLYRCELPTKKIERVAGIGRTEQGLDGPTPLESGFHTVLVVYSPDAETIYTCGGDESVPRRIQKGQVKSLCRDGIFRRYVKQEKDERWRQMAAVQCLDRQGRLYACTGDYGWGGWIVRFTFKDQQAEEK